MVFADLFFIYIFLPVLFIVYYAGKNLRYRNLVLIVASLIFYGWGEPVWITLLLFSSILDFTCGKFIHKHKGEKIRVLGLIASLVLNLGLLFVFKYSGFLMGNINAIFGTSFPVPNISLPIGISFYTFQTLSYTIDVYLGKAKVQKSFLNFLLFVSLFSQLVAGPIVRYVDIANEIDDRRVTANDLSCGFFRMIIGLAKKVVIANTAGKLAGIYMAQTAGQTVLGAWIGAIMFSLQIYYDFSGYSDMAIGMGRMFGFHFLENFNYPYIAKSATEFWRRWHMSLGSFFRDYVYIPLGGNRKRQYFNLFVVWFLTGMWHGASWNFILWGLYFGFFIAMERVCLKKFFEKLPGFVSNIYLIIMVIVGWVLFYFTDLSQGLNHIKNMFFLGGLPFSNTAVTATLLNNIFWFIIAILFCMPISKIFAKISNRLENMSQGGVIVSYSIKGVISVVALIVVTMLLVGQSYNPFLYFRF